MWEVHWRRPIHWWLASFAIGPVFAGSMASLLAISGSTQRDLGLFVGGAAGGFGMFVLGAAFLSLAGIDLRNNARAVEPTFDARWGAGIRLRQRSRGPLIAAFFSVAVWAAVATIVQFHGQSESLLPSSRDNDGGGAIVLGMAIGLFTFTGLALMTTRTDAVLHVDGISRRVRRRRLFNAHSSEEFLRWDDIDAIEPDTFDVHTTVKTLENPIIRVVSNQLDAERKLERSETDNSIVLRAYEFGVEPNALMSLVLWCYENPELRGRLAHSDARRLLNAPPLRERLRLSREAVESAK